MPTYRHLDHAGNFADVHKHLVLTRLLSALRADPAPFFCLDTHGGAGRYELPGEGPAKEGIGRLWPLDEVPKEAVAYRNVVQSENPSGVLRCYPGSPRTIRYFMREGDRLVVSELLDSEVARLSALFAGDPRVEVRQADGYRLLECCLPPGEDRGVVLIDPPYEHPDEFIQAAAALIEGCQRWPAGVFALWYPITTYARVTDLHQTLVEAGMRHALVSEFCRRAPELADRLNGSGMIVVNPPATLAAELDRALPWLRQRLSPGLHGVVRNMPLVAGQAGRCARHTLQ